MCEPHDSSEVLELKMDVKLEVVRYEFDVVR